MITRVKRKIPATLILVVMLCLITGTVRPAAMTAASGRGTVIKTEVASEAPLSVQATYSISNAKVTGIKAKSWTGKAVLQSPMVEVGGKTLKKGTDYTLSYSNNKNVGTAKVMIRGKGEYTGSLSKSFRILPKVTKLSKCVPAVKQITAYWNKQAQQNSGYQIQCCTKSTFKSGVKTVTIKESSKTSGKVAGLKAATTYYVRVRTYKTVGSKIIYSSWSSKKIVRTKAAATAGKTGSGTVAATPSSGTSDGGFADTQFIANKNTKKFHRSTCSSVNKMSEKNKWYADCSRSELINKGYDPCKICKP